jgi:hypothetical protein
MSKLTEVIFNLIGTLMDHGGKAPSSAVKSGFLTYGIHVPQHIISESAGQTMYNQVNILCQNPHIIEQWDIINARQFKQSDINMISGKVYRRLEEEIKTHAKLIDGAYELTQELRDSGVKIGITSEYGYHITHSVLPYLVSQGLVWDNLVCIDQVEHTTESILATWFNSNRCYNSEREYLKIGSTDLDIWEGLVVGIPTCNIVDSSQLMGLTNMELAGTIREKYNATAGEIIKRWERINCTYHTKTVGDVSVLLAANDC